ncbi:MAG: hypothetical protein ACQER5_10725 [Pseudomonadota bacterium]
MRKLILGASAIALGLSAGSVSAGNNDLLIQQVNDFNFASGSQTGSNNETFIRQADNNNGASVPVIGNGNDMLVIQETRRNFAEAAMGSGGNQNRTAILQRGGNGNLTVGPNPSGGAGGQGDRNTFASVQDGSNNVVNGGGNRSGGTGLGGGTWSIDDISTQGSFDAGLVPSGLPAGGGSGHSVLAGSDNVTLLGQTGSDNRFGVMTVGNQNTIAGFQDAGSLTSIDMNTEAGANFFGDKGLSDTTLDAGDASASNGLMGWAVDGFATQAGVNNVAHLVQVGDNNTIAFNQLSSDNTAQIYQQGNTNGAIAVQN